MCVDAFNYSVSNSAEDNETLRIRTENESLRRRVAELEFHCTNILCSAHTKYDPLCRICVLSQNCVLESEILALKGRLSEAVRIIRAGKQKFIPHTTNSDVDVFLAKEDLLVPKKKDE